MQNPQESPEVLDNESFVERAYMAGYESAGSYTGEVEMARHVCRAHLSICACVFVYGTLMSDQRNNAVLSPYGTLKSRAIYHGARLYNLFSSLEVPGAFPAVVSTPEEPEQQVRGELWVVWSADGLYRMDQMERAFNASMYRRVLREVETPQQVMRAWVYEWALPGRAMYPLPSGDWAQAMTDHANRVSTSGA